MALASSNFSKGDGINCIIWLKKDSTVGALSIILDFRVLSIEDLVLYQIVLPTWTNFFFENGSAIYLCGDCRYKYT
jgi:hypothetical protein